MKTRTNLHAGKTVCPEANLWKKRANDAADALSLCKKINKVIPDYPVYVIPNNPITGLPIGGGEVAYDVGGYVTGRAYDGRDYSGYCG